jgi:hypothetical protein
VAFRQLCLTLSRYDALFTILVQLGHFDTYVLLQPHTLAFAGLLLSKLRAYFSNHLLNFRRYSVVKDRSVYDRGECSHLCVLSLLESLSRSCYLSCFRISD